MKKVFQIAKELGIDSKAIVAKCKAEDIPNIETHMSPVGAGLEATIKEWFSTSAPQTAVETSEHVDLTKVRKARPSRAKRAGGHAHEGEGDSTTAVAEPPHHTHTESEAAAEAGVLLSGLVWVVRHCSIITSCAVACGHMGAAAILAVRDRYT